MHAFLIVGATADQQLRLINGILDVQGVADGPNDRYLVSPTETSIGVDEVRRAQAWIGQWSSRPRACIIPDADRLTQVAQHAILKTIEEPSSDQTIFVMSASSEHAMLPTLRSRCVIRRAATSSGASPREPFCIPRSELLSQTGTDRESAERVFDRLVHHAHQTLVSSSSRKTLPPRILRAALNASMLLKAQCNPASVVRQFLLDIPTPP